MCQLKIALFSCKFQVVGVSDSGIDMGSCYFWDPDYKVSKRILVKFCFYTSIPYFV